MDPGIEGWGRGGLSVDEGGCWGACESTVGWTLAAGIRRIQNTKVKGSRGFPKIRGIKQFGNRGWYRHDQAQEVRADNETFRSGSCVENRHTNMRLRLISGAFDGSVGWSVEVVGAVFVGWEGRCLTEGWSASG